MFNKRFMKKLLDLNDNINELEFENARLRQTINLKNRVIEQIATGSYEIINNKEVTRNINELKAELTYWKETAEYWKNVAFEFERHNKYLKELNKSVDK